MYERISFLVEDQDAFLQTWTTRYGMGVWACLGTTEIDVDEVRNSTSDGDMDWIAAFEHITTTEWLPLEMAPTLLEALNKLETRLSTFPSDMLCRGSVWWTAVMNAYENFRLARIESNNRVGSSLNLRTLPRTFQEMLLDRDLQII